MLKIIATSASLVAAIGIGVAALLFSPSSCACLSPSQELLLQADLDYSSERSISDYSFQQIEKALNNALKGKQITPGQPHQRFLNCTPITKTEFECSDVLERSLLFQRGYTVHITVDSQDFFQRADLRQYWAWL